MSSARVQESRWEARPWLARALRVAIFIAPLALCTLVTEGLAAAWQPQSHRDIWVGCLALVALIVGFGTERVARRFLPLAALLQLTLLFPDRAPSRLKIARTSGSGTRLAEKLASRPDDSAGTAAEKVLSLITALGNHDRKTRGHSERVRLFTDMIATELRLPERDRDRLRWASLLHDVGKLRIAPALLNKPDALTTSEFDKIRQHPAVGAELAGPLLLWLGEWGRGILEHHERYDGKGYPAGLASTAISRSGRIINVADAFETMTAARAYKKPLAMKAARAELANCAGSQFDPEYVRAFLAISLPKLLWGVGPLSFAGQLPFLRALMTAGNRAASLSGQVGVASAGVAAVTSIGVAAAIGVPAPAVQPHHAAPHHVTATPSSHPSAAAHHHRARRRGRIPEPTTTARSTPAPAPTATPTATPTAPHPPATPTPTPTPTATKRTPPPSPTPTATKTTPTVLVPHAPTDVAATAGDATATVTWDAPDSNGGAAITIYTVTVYDNGVPARTKTVNSGRTTTLTGLTDGDRYTFTVTATNSVGDSDASKPSAAVTPEAPLTVPSAPLDATATAGDGTATVSWTSPASDGGSALIGYTVSAYDSGSLVLTKTVHADETSASITGLTDGETYTFTIVATNSVGDSAPSDPTPPVSPAAAATVPDQPTTVISTAGDATVDLNWTAPDTDGGSAITHYIVTVYDNGTEVTTKHVSADNTSTTITGLTDGDSYTFTVTAVNNVGPSNPSAPSTAVTPVAPVTTLGLPPAYGFDVPSGVVTVSVLKNAPAGMDPTTLQVTSPPDHGTATANPDGTVTYTADATWTGTTTFTFSACTTTNACGTQTASIQILPQKEPWCDASGLDLTNANLSGVDFSHCTFAGADLTGANLVGTTFHDCDLVNVTFTNANLTNGDLDGSDVQGATANGTVLTGATISELTGGTGPTTSPVTLSTKKSTAVSSNIAAAATDTDVPVDPSSLAVVSGPSHGTVVLHSDGSVTYTPKSGYVGTDKLTLSIANMFGFTSTVVVTVSTST